MLSARRIANFLVAFVLLTAAANVHSSTETTPATDNQHPERIGSLAIRPLPGNLGNQRARAQQLVISDSRIIQRVTDRASGEVLRSAVFGVYPLPESDIVEASESCRRSVCYRIDIYNYAFNATFSVVVDVFVNDVILISRYIPGQPEIPDYLAVRALEIAVESPRVEEALGFKPSMRSALMPNVKTSLNNTACESSGHLCVAPTFVLEKEGTALWAIVDLTDERLVAVRWTHLGEAKRIRPTEQSIQRDEIYDTFCRVEQTLERDGWRFDYSITSSDGLEVSNVTFNGDPVIASAKLVDWHVSYSRDEGFGYSDAIGCPKYSSAAVGALEGPSVEEIGGDAGTAFAFVQDFHHPLWPAPCNYRYKQRFEFYPDGRLRIAGGQYGRGCGVGATYRPIWRIVPVAPEAARFSEWSGTTWQPWDTEQWQLQDDQTAYQADRFQYRFGTDDKGWLIEPGHGQVPHNRGDHAYVYATRRHPDEGDADLVTIGPCCNKDHQQGPERFIDSPPERLDGTSTVIWYVAQLENDSTPGSEYCWADNIVTDGLYEPRAWPCYSGPLFVPYGSEHW